MCSKIWVNKIKKKVNYIFVRYYIKWVHNNERNVFAVKTSIRSLFFFVACYFKIWYHCAYAIHFVHCTYLSECFENFAWARRLYCYGYRICVFFLCVSVSLSVFLFLFICSIFRLGICRNRQKLRNERNWIKLRALRKQPTTEHSNVDGRHRTRLWKRKNEWMNKTHKFDCVCVFVRNVNIMNHFSMWFLPTKWTKAYWNTNRQMVTMMMFLTIMFMIIVIIVNCSTSKGQWQFYYNRHNHFVYIQWFM